MAAPLRFRRSSERWSGDRVRDTLLSSLQANIGARMDTPWYRPPEGFAARRFEMDNGDVALFAWDGNVAFWIGNTETPSALWRTEKYTFAEVPAGIADWTERELLAQLHQEAPWLEAYPTLSWFFLPVLLSKDGRETTRAFLREHAAGFPDAGRDEALSFYEEFLATGALDEHRYTMAAKLGTSEQLDPHRMAATMSEFTAAKLLHDAGYVPTPEVPIEGGYSLDFRADPDATLVEVTRPRPPSRRSAGTPAAALRETAATKVDGQLAAEPGTVLLVDCSSFRDDQWAPIRDERPDVGYSPAVVFRARPDGRIEGYAVGSVPVELSALAPA